MLELWAALTVDLRGAGAQGMHARRLLSVSMLEFGIKIEGHWSVV